MEIRRGIVVVAVAAAAFGALTACQPPARTVFTVTTTADLADAAPGDGVCEASPGAGNCTLRAAIAEANRVPSADVRVPADLSVLSPSVVDPDGQLDLDITGDLLLNGGATVAVRVDSPGPGPAIDIHAGGRFRASGLGETTVGAPIRVAGSLTLDRSQVASFSTATPALEVLPGGRAVLSNTVVGGFGGPLGAVVNDGTLLTAYTQLTGIDAPALNSSVGATTSITTTLISRLRWVHGGVTPDPAGTLCTGAAPTSNGFNHATNGSCSLGQATDVQVATTAPVDRIPVGTSGCGTAYVVDVISNPRPVDGDADGVAACDIGAFEQSAG